VLNLKFKYGELEGGIDAGGSVELSYPFLKINRRCNQERNKHKK